MAVTRFPPLYSIKEILQLYEIRALRKLSQNFLLDPRLNNKIVKAAGSIQDCEVLEIGPGPGGITRSLLMGNPKKLTVVEKDLRFQPVLSSLQAASGGKLSVIYGDILDFDCSDLFDNSLKKDWNDSSPNIHIVGNLPFNVADVLIFQFLEDISLRRNAWSFGRIPLTLIFQEEVAVRMTSEILSKMRSRISVMCQNWCDVRFKFSIAGKAFLPKAEVNAAVVKFVPLIEPIIDLDFGLVEKVVRVTFNCRQKFIYNTVKNLFPIRYREALTEEIFQMADVNKKFRPFQLDMLEWKRLCYAYKDICDRYPGVYEYDFRGPKATRESLPELAQEVN